MNRLPAAEDRKRQRKKKKGKEEEEEETQEGREQEVNEYTRPRSSLLLKWRGEQNPAAIGKGRLVEEDGWGGGWGGLGQWNNKEWWLNDRLYVTGTDKWQRRG